VPSRATPVTASGQVGGTPASVAGWGFRATADAVVNLRAGTTVAGAIVESITITVAGGSRHHDYSSALALPEGLFVEVASGTVVGSVRT
jgi:hypothetical protein